MSADPDGPHAAAWRLRRLGVPAPKVTDALHRAIRARLDKDRDRRTYLAEAQRMGYTTREAELVLAAVDAALERPSGHLNRVMVAAGVLATHPSRPPQRDT